MALSQLKGLLKTLEESRQDVKAPVLQLGRDIDDKAREFAKTITSEATRLQALITTYYRQQAEKVERARRISEDLARKKREAAEAEARKARRNVVVFRRKLIKHQRQKRAFACMQKLTSRHIRRNYC